MTQIMGVLNLTPDSFSDGGLYTQREFALDHAKKLLRDGADILDIGGESTKPGSKRVDAKEEWNRIGFCLQDLIHYSQRTERSFLISVDTIHDETAKKAVELGCGMLNNIKAFYSEECMYYLASIPKLQYVASHTVADPEVMQKYALTPANVVEEIEAFLDSSYQKLLGFGFDSSRIFLDPGIGFGKTVEANLLICSKIKEWSLRFPICMGVSRKSFLGTLFNIEKPSDRDPVSKVLEYAMALMGVRIIRTHDVLGLVPLLSAVDGARKS